MLHWRINFARMRQSGMLQVVDILESRKRASRSKVQAPTPSAFLAKPNLVVMLIDLPTTVYLLYVLKNL